MMGPLDFLKRLNVKQLIINYFIMKKMQSTQRFFRVIERLPGKNRGNSSIERGNCMRFRNRSFRKQLFLCQQGGSVQLERAILAQKMTKIHNLVKCCRGHDTDFFPSSRSLKTFIKLFKTLTLSRLDIITICCRNGPVSSLQFFSLNAVWGD